MIANLFFALGLLNLAATTFVISILIKIKKTMPFSQQVQDLAAAVANETAVEQSAIKLIQGLAAQISGAASSGDLAQVETLAQQINTNAAALAAAVTANTPSAPVAQS